MYLNSKQLANGKAQDYVTEFTLFFFALLAMSVVKKQGSPNTALLKCRVKILEVGV